VSELASVPNTASPAKDAPTELTAETCISSSDLNQLNMCVKKELISGYLASFSNGQMNITISTGSGANVVNSADVEQTVETDPNEELKSDAMFCQDALDAGELDLSLDSPTAEDELCQKIRGEAAVKFLDEAHAFIEERYPDVKPNSQFAQNMVRVMVEGRDDLINNLGADENRNKFYADTSPEALEAYLTVGTNAYLKGLERLRDQQIADGEKPIEIRNTDLRSLFKYEEQMIQRPRA